MTPITVYSKYVEQYPTAGFSAFTRKVPTVPEIGHRFDYQRRMWKVVDVVWDFDLPELVIRVTVEPIY